MRFGNPRLRSVKNILLKPIENEYLQNSRKKSVTFFFEKNVFKANIHDIFTVELKKSVIS